MIEIDLKYKSDDIKIPDEMNIHISWSDEDEVYICECKEYESLKTHGATLQEAYNEFVNVLNIIFDNIEGWK